MYIYWQQEAGQSAWLPALARDRDRVVQEKQPRLTTVLAVSKLAEDAAPEEMLGLKYSGPFYADFDSDDLAVSIRQFNKFLDRLEGRGVNLRQCYLYATGNRGFHIEVPMPVFHAKPPKDGIVQLPAIYREVAFDHIVDCLDMRVYTAKRGRMWRVPNIKRENGAYKVPISVAEARAMTPEKYAEFCATPRPYGVAVPVPEAPELAIDFSLDFTRAEQKIAEALKRRKNSKVDEKLLAKHKGKVPPSVEALLAGVGVNHSVGWNKIAMQVAIVMCALRKTEDQIVEAARRLIETHVGDGNRYGTPKLREEELRAQIRYTADNPCYAFSVGAIKSVLEAGTPTPDLEGLTDETEIKAHVEAQQALQAESGETPTHVGNIIITPTGIFQKSEEGRKAISAVGFDLESIIALTMATADAPAGFEAVMFYRGRRKRVVVTYDVLQSRSRLNAFFSATMGGTFSGSDIQAGFVQEWLGVMAQRNNERMQKSDDMLIRREGLDVIQLPATMDVPEPARTPFQVFASPEGCVVSQRVEEAGLKFRFLGDPNASGYHKSDIARAPELENDERTRKTIEALFSMNRERNVAACLGWFIAAHGRMFYHRLRRTFPLLSISGQAGSGKTETVRTLMRLHFYLKDPPQVQCPGATIYGINTAIASSASIPVWLDEYKPREMGPAKTGNIRAILRACYDNGTLIKGGANTNVMSNGREIVETTYSGPTMFLAEATEMESAILERSVVVLLDKTGVHGRAAHLRTVQQNLDVLSAIGRQVLLSLLGTSLEAFGESFDNDYEIAEREVLDKDNYRVVFCYAVARHGLTMLDEVLQHAGMNFSERLGEMKEMLMQVPNAMGTTTTRVRSEASKVLSTFSTMSKIVNMQGYPLLAEGTDFAYSQAGGVDTIEISLTFAFAKYQQWQATRNQTPLFDSEEQFIVAMGNYSAFVDETAEKLIDKPHVMRFNLDTLLVEGVEPFARRS